VSSAQRQAAAERLTGQLPVETAATVPAPPTGVTPGVKEMGKLYHGTRHPNPESFIDENGNLVLRASENFEGRQVAVSFSESQDVALDYATRTPGTGPARSMAQGAVFEIDASAIPAERLFVESGEEIATRGLEPIIIPQGKYRIIKDIAARTELEQWEAQQIARVRRLSDQELAVEHNDAMLAGEFGEFNKVFEDPFSRLAPGISTDIVAKHGPVMPDSFPIWREMIRRVTNSNDPEGTIARIVSGLPDNVPPGAPRISRENLAADIRRELATPSPTGVAPAAEAVEATVKGARAGGTVYHAGAGTTMEGITPGKPFHVGSEGSAVQRIERPLRTPDMEDESQLWRLMRQDAEGLPRYIPAEELPIEPHFISEHQIRPKKPFLPNGKLLDERLGDDRTYLSTLQNMPELSEVTRRAGWISRNQIIDQGYDVIPYINAREAPGTVSYMVLDPSALQTTGIRTGQLRRVGQNYAGEFVADAPTPVTPGAGVAAEAVIEKDPAFMQIGISPVTKAEQKGGRLVTPWYGEVQRARVAGATTQNIEAVYSEVVEPARRYVLHQLTDAGFQDINVAPNFGRIFGEAEPSLFVTARVDPGQTDDFLRLMAKIADVDFNQDSVLLHRPLTPTEGAPPFGIYDDVGKQISQEEAEEGLGWYSIEPFVRYTKPDGTPITAEEFVVINKAVDDAKLAGYASTVDNRGVDFINVGLFGTADDFEAKIWRFHADTNLSGILPESTSSSAGVRRLDHYGRGESGTDGLVGYDAVERYYGPPTARARTPEEKDFLAQQNYDEYKRWEAGTEGIPGGPGDGPLSPSSVGGVPPSSRGPPRLAPPGGEGEEPLSGFAANIRLSKYPEDIQGAIWDWAEANPELIEEARRGVRTDAQVLEDARRLADEAGGDFDKIQRKWKPGEAWNAEEITAIRGTLRAKAQEAFDASRAVNADNSAENLLKLAGAIQEQGRVQQVVHGVSAEGGRALRAFRQEAFDAISSGEAQKMEELLKRMENLLGSRAKVEEMAEKIAALDINNPYQVNKFLRDITKPKLWDYIVEVFYNSILSGPKTHIINSSSNTATALLSPVERLFIAGVERVLAPLQRRRIERFWDEIPVDLLGLFSGLPEGVRAALKTVTTGVDPGQASKWEFRQKAFRGPLGEVIRIPGTALEAMDQLGKTVNTRAALWALAMRKARMEGHKGLKAKARMDEIIHDPPADMLVEASRIAEERLFRAPPGQWTQAIMNVRNLELTWAGNAQPFRFVIPFLRTPSNLLKFGIQRSPLGFADPALWKALASKSPEASDRLGRSMLGSVIGGAIAAMVATGQMDIVGFPPADRAERDRFYREGKQPFSIRIGPYWIQYQRVEPWNQTLSQMAIAIKAIRDKDASIDEKVGTAAATIGRNLVSQTYLSGLSDLLNAANDPERYGKRWITRPITGMMPFSALLRTAAQIVDPTFRRSNNILEAFAKNIPLLSKTVPPVITAFGEEAKREWPAWSPFVVTPDQQDMVDAELERLNVEIGFVGDSIGGVKLNRQQQLDYQMVAGKYVYEALVVLMRTNKYENAPDASKETLIISERDDVRDAVRKYMLERIKFPGRYAEQLPEPRGPSITPTITPPVVSTRAPEPVLVPAGGGISQEKLEAYRAGPPPNWWEKP